MYTDACTFAFFFRTRPLPRHDLFSLVNNASPWGGFCADSSAESLNVKGSREGSSSGASGGVDGRGSSGTVPGSGAAKMNTNTTCPGGGAAYKHEAYSVPNYPLPKLKAWPKRRYRIVEFLRKVEQKETQAALDDATARQRIGMYAYYRIKRCFKDDRSWRRIEVGSGHLLYAYIIIDDGIVIIITIQQHNVSDEYHHPNQSRSTAQRHRSCLVEASLRQGRRLLCRRAKLYSSPLFPIVRDGRVHSHSQQEQEHVENDQQKHECIRHETARCKSRPLQRANSLLFSPPSTNCGLRIRQPWLLETQDLEDADSCSPTPIKELTFDDFASAMESYDQGTHLERLLKMRAGSNVAAAEKASGKPGGGGGGGGGGGTSAGATTVATTAAIGEAADVSRGVII